MRSVLTKVIVAGSLLPLAGLTAGCVVHEREHTRREVIVREEPRREVVREEIIIERPPPAIVEVRPSRPGAEYFWVEGHHVHGRDGWHWEHGHWDQRSHGYVWIEGRWVDRR